ncbi:MAG: hypothetical protein DWI21_11735 [Planctomycetota bacterium]|nr:MAG: hypothetical protein DWI21_11735 [Planctomycetota bacterium]
MALDLTPCEKALAGDDRGQVLKPGDLDSLLVNATNSRLMIASCWMTGSKAGPSGPLTRLIRSSTRALAEPATTGDHFSH